MPDLTETTVATLPHCDFCGGGEALYDGRTIHGRWAYMCERHFDSFGIGLGTGKGQRLLLRRET